MRYSLYFLSPPMLLALACNAGLAGSMAPGRMADLTPAERQARLGTLDLQAMFLRDSIPQDLRRLANLKAGPSTSPAVQQEINRLQRDIHADRALLRATEREIPIHRQALRLTADLRRDRARLAQLQQTSPRSPQVQREINGLMRDIPADQARLRSVLGQLGAAHRPTAPFRAPVMPARGRGRR
jgi:hypothetical protein